MRKIYQSKTREFVVPTDKVDALLNDLEGAIKTESNRVRAYAGMNLITPNVSTPSGFNFDSLRMARESGRYSNVSSLAGNEIVVWSEAVPFRDGRYEFGILTSIDYAKLKLEDDVAKVRMTEQKGLASNPKVVETVLAQYAL